MRSTTYNDDGSVLESVVLCQDEGLYGGDIPKGVWNGLESLGSGSVGVEGKGGMITIRDLTTLSATR